MIYIKDWKDALIDQIETFVDEMELESETGYNNRLLFNSSNNFWKRFVYWKNGDRWDLADDTYAGDSDDEH